MGRRNSESEFRLFVRSIADEIDLLSSREQRDALLRLVGRRMASTRPLPATGDLAALELEMNEVLSDLNWGQVRLTFDAHAHCVWIAHAGLPGLGSRADWLAACLEGLYAAWLSSQPGADQSLILMRVDDNPDHTIMMRYFRPNRP